MVQEGAMIGVDEVYGCHNWPYGKPGEMYVKTGYMMSCATSLNITVREFLVIEANFNKDLWKRRT